MLHCSNNLNMIFFVYKSCEPFFMGFFYIFFTYTLFKKSWLVPSFDIPITFSWQISSVTAQVICCFHFFIILIFSIFRRWDDPRHHWHQTDLFLTVSMTGTPTFCMTCMPLFYSLCVYEEVEENLTVSVYVVQGGWTALLYASWNGHLSIVEVLLDRGADINHRDMVR